MLSKSASSSLHYRFAHLVDILPTVAHRVVVLKALVLQVDGSTRPVDVIEIDREQDDVLLEQIRLSSSERRTPSHKLTFFAHRFSRPFS